MERERTFVPEPQRAAIARYVEQGVYPGTALTLILENRPLGDILGHVDAETEIALGSIWRFLYNGVGSPAWGTPERVAAWRERGGMEGG